MVQKDSDSTNKTSAPANSVTGMPGLDEVLRGGLTPNRLYLIEGDPGAGKTTLALCYLLEGARQGEPGLYVTLSETKEELGAVAKSHGWSLDAINVFELIASEESLSQDSQYTMYHPSETELGETTAAILKEVERIKPRRIVFDSLSELRLLAQDPLRYRRQILAFKQFFTGRQCTVLLLDDRTAASTDVEVKREHRARRDFDGAALAGIRRRAPSPPRSETPRQALPRWVPRLPDHSRRGARFPAPDRRRTPQAFRT
jgi:circadian clock protein KaiC